MISITIGRKKYKGPYSWDDITLKKYYELAKIPMPEGYESFILADGKFNVDRLQEYVEAVSKITDKQLNEDFPAYYRKVILCLTNIPASVLDKISNEQVTEKYEYFFKPFVISLIYHKPVIHFMGQIRDYEPGYIHKNRVRIGWSYYYLPESVNIEGENIPLHKEPILTYTEACDIFKAMKVSKDDVDKLALFMAIYMRKKGEKYNDKRALSRKELMMNVPMSLCR